MMCTHISLLFVWFVDLRNMDYFCYLHEEALLQAWHSVCFYLWDPQIAPLDNRGHLSRLNCHTNRFFVSHTTCIGEHANKNKIQQFKTTNLSSTDTNKSLYFKWIRITIDHISCVWVLHIKMFLELILSSFWRWFNIRQAWSILNTSKHTRKKY